MIFNGHDYSIDCIKSLSDSMYFTGSQDGSINIWSLKKKKPIFSLKDAHSGGWITALVTFLDLNKNREMYKILISQPRVLKMG